MTLSHRWGPVNHMTLTKDTYPELLKGVPLSVLPRLFQDAIFICHHLGIGLICIDSLCIFQGEDNILDWQKEASLMSNVYSNSFCNISAADSPDCSDSMFASRNPCVTILQEVQMIFCGDREGEKTTERFILSDYKFWK